MDLPFLTNNSTPRMYPESGYVYPNILLTDTQYAQQIFRRCSFTNDPEQIMAAKKSLKTFKQVAFLCAIFMVSEFVGGIISNSVAVYSDALHMLSDMTGYFINIFGLVLSIRKPSPFFTFGSRRVEIVGAIFSILLIWVLSLFLVIKAAARIVHPPTVSGPVMVLVASLGIVTNVLIACLLSRSGHGHSHFGVSECHGHGHGHDSSHGESPCAGQGHRSSDVSVHVDKKAQSQNAGHGHAHNCKGHGHSHKSGSHASSDANNSLESKKCGHDHTEHSGNQAHTAIGGILDYSDGSLTEENHSSDSESHLNISIKSAYLHTLGDLLQNIGVLLAGVMICVNPKEFMIMDPICTLFFAFNVFAITVPTAYRCFYVLMDTVPKSMDTTKILSSIRNIKYVQNVRDFHIWSVGMESLAFTVILDVYGDEHGCNCSKRSGVTKKVRDIAEDNGITHCNVEILEISLEEKW